MSYEKSKSNKKSNKENNCNKNSNKSKKIISYLEERFVAIKSDNQKNK